jgi:hypothetical protein
MVGSAFSVEYRNYPAQSSALLLNMHLLGDALPAPVPLAVLGLLPSTAQCAIGLNLIAVDGLTYDTTYGIMRMPYVLNVPYSPSLAGAAFTTQPASLEIVPNGLAAHTGPATEWTIGSGAGDPGVTTVYNAATAGNPVTTGVVVHGRSVTLALN